MGAVKVIIKAGYLIAWLTSYFDELSEINKRQTSRCAGELGKQILNVK